MSDLVTIHIWSIISPLFEFYTLLFLFWSPEKQSVDRPPLRARTANKKEPVTGKKPITGKEPSSLMKEPITSLMIKNCHVAGLAAT